MLLIIISPPENIPNEPEIVASLFLAGLQTFHLRKPSFSSDELEKYIKGIPVEYHPRIVLHSHYPLTLKYDLKGIHLTEHTKNNKNTDDYLKKSGYRSISASFHSLEDIQQNPGKYDYLFLSPIFDSISKSDYKSNFNLRSVAAFIKTLPPHINIPIVALGGITEKHIGLVKEAGFAGVALLGAIWESSDPVHAFSIIQSKTRHTFL